MSTVPTPLFALVDVNNFYVSCERLFQPRYADKAMVVLSNNDHCVVARSNEVKALGIKMGAPWFKHKDLARAHGILAMSSNYTLYGDLSNRVVEVLRGLCPDIEVYSIDESFLRIERVLSIHGGAVPFGHVVKNRLLRWIGLPVCVGIGSTKTLAKFANRLAKKQAAFAGVCDVSDMTVGERDTWMSATAVEDVWGIGSKLAARLASEGIHTVLDLTRADPRALRARYGVVMERIITELNGQPCLELETAPPPKQQIIASRSFGVSIEDLASLQSAVTTFMSRAAEKLRRDHSLAGAVGVFIMTNPFKPEEPQYSRFLTVPLPTATDDTRRLADAAAWGLKALYRPGLRYKKAGVMLTLLTPKANRQSALFMEPRSEASDRLMVTLDSINRRMGRDTLRLAASGFERPWSMRANQLSPRFTTRWTDLPQAR